MKRYLCLLLTLMLLLPGCAPKEPAYAASKKPVIYLYPEEVTEVSVELDYAGELTCVYPA